MIKYHSDFGITYCGRRMSAMFESDTYNSNLLLEHNEFNDHFTLSINGTTIRLTDKELCSLIYMFKEARDLVNEAP